MQITFDKLEEAKAYVSNGGATFQTPEFYMKKFMEIMKVAPGQVSFEAQGKVENANEDQSINVAYARLKAEVKMDFNNDIMEKTIGMVIALDTQNPIIKVYSGSRVFACTNLCISNADNVFSANAMQNLESGFAMLDQYRINADKEWTKSLEIWNTMQSTTMSSVEVEQKLGEMLRKVIKGGQFKQLGTNPITRAAKYLFGSDGPYRISDNGTTVWNVYNAMTQSITDTKEIVTAPNKTLIATKLILN